MIGGIIGDVIGSIYESKQWISKELPLVQELPLDSNMVVPIFENTHSVRLQYSWTDDTLCTLGLYKAYVNKTDFAQTLQSFCITNMNESVGFGQSFKNWLSNTKPYNSYANGSIMRIGFVPFLPLSLIEKLTLVYEMTEISHNHPDSFMATEDYIKICHYLKKDFSNNDFSKKSLKEYLQKKGFSLNVEDMHNKKYFELNALQTLLQAVAIVLESNSFEEVLRNTFYVGGDSDTIATVACNIASIIYPISEELMYVAELSMANNQELFDLVVNFSENYWVKF